MMTDMQTDEVYDLTLGVRHSLAAAMTQSNSLLFALQRARGMTPGKTESGVFKDVVKVGFVLLVTFAIGSSYPSPPMPVYASASQSVLAGQSAMLRKDYTFACKHFKEAVAAGANPEFCLGLKAECEFFDGNDAEALKTCGELEDKTNGASKNAPYIRGLVLLKQKQVAGAKESLLIAEMRGHPQATHRLAKLAKAEAK